MASEDNVDPQTRPSSRPPPSARSSPTSTRAQRRQNIDLMDLAGFCRNCLARWCQEAAAARRDRAVDGRDPRAGLRHAPTTSGRPRTSGERRPCASTSRGSRSTTPGRGTYDVGASGRRGGQRQSGIRRGLVTVFLHHTSASLILCENADPAVRADLERFFAGTGPRRRPALRPQTTGAPTTCRPTSGRSSPETRRRCRSAAVASTSAPGRGSTSEHQRAAHRRRLTVTVVGDDGE